ncbi:MAG: hypothetical protein H6Q15_806 [Bacteroidetes bacterium]|nr:hypothetical protein [Bacteroidota bacterium]
MKRTILFLLLSFSAIHGFAQEHKINISIDTTYIRLKQITKPAINISLRNAVKFNNRYYCIINEDPLTQPTWDKNKFIIISDKGDSIREVELFDCFLTSVYTDLFIYKDKITIKDYYTYKTYYLDTINYKWIETEEADDLIYEDEEFYVTYMDFGEWGSTTWFRNKKTNKEYDIVGFNKVFRLNGDFYLIGYGGVNILKDRSKLKHCNEEYYYNIIKDKRSSKNKSSNGSDNIPKFVKSFQDTTYDPFSYSHNLSIITSFITDNRLYHICSDSIQNYIGYVSNNNMIIVDTLPKDVEMFNHGYRCRVQKDNSQIIKFEQKGDENQFGFIVIKDNNIKVRYFIHDIDSINYIDKEKFDKAFDSIFNYIISNKDITISQIDSLENIYGGIDTKLVFGKKNIGDSKHNLQGGKRYFKIQDSIISNYINYFYTEKDSLVKKVYFEWSITPTYKRVYVGVIPLLDPFIEPPYKKDFDIKFNEILDKITKQLGKPKIEKWTNFTNYKWEKEGFFDLELGLTSFERIRIYLNKD